MSNTPYSPLARTPNPTASGFKIRLPARSVPLRGYIEIDSDSSEEEEEEEEENVCDRRYTRRDPPDPSKYTIGRSGRAIAGSKRVAKFRGSANSSAPVMQGTKGANGFSASGDRDMSSDMPVDGHIQTGAAQGEEVDVGMDDTPKAKDGCGFGQ
ncbi:hypothetical protein Hypma_007376 [Hypsizygus marmoreus]|uniref:Uncharacterized protein n=1 Tax=Hypsizygus marmoreus TaxID=39966 RepID=A0A369JV89_HYPMA|nr:hypothetical protein Hypma_007376 [Hypsizygus marmoreus]